jgi:glycosyltransferase involved in cell wall biosynthesis
MYVSINQAGVIQAISKEKAIRIDGNNTVHIPSLVGDKSLIGKRVVVGGGSKSLSEFKVAGICNWGDQCGIATYSEQLIPELRKHVKEVRIFAETKEDADDDVERCWKRGQSCIELAKQILDYEPDVIFIQHEFGIFPKATHFLKLLEMFDNIPYVITLHSVYEHLDKTICTSYIKNIITHNPNGKVCLEKFGHRNQVFVLPHGCNVYENVQPLWNIFQNERTIIQFGFGFDYKGLDCAIEAVNILKNRSEEFKDIFYCFLCSESNHTRSIQTRYYNEIRKLVEEKGLQDNVVVLRGYLSEQHMQNFLRTAKLAVFPYKNDPKNTVYGASGAVRKAMSNGIPVIASDCHLFDDLDGVVPRPSNPEDLADEIAKVFTSAEYRSSLLKKSKNFITENSWECVGRRYAEILEELVKKEDSDVIRIDTDSIVI